VATARAQLRSVLTKTGTGRQSELVRLVLSSDNRLRKE
jgi:DNA-binding CsgD family transcriptional regulator